MPLTPSEILAELGQIKYDLSVTQTRIGKAIEHIAAMNLSDEEHRSRVREFRAYDPPADPNIAIRQMIANGAMDSFALEAEIAALGVDGAEAESLRALLPVGVAAREEASA